MSSKKLLLCIFFIALAKSVFFSHIGFGLLDEGESLHNATRILQGDLPYRDFFAIFPPLDNYFFAFLVSLFGKSIIFPRIVMSTIFSIGIAFCFKFLATHTTKFWAFLTCLVIIFLDLNVERLFFFAPIFISIFLLFKKQKIDLKALFFAGVLLGIVATFRADIPASYFLSFALYLLLFSQSKIKNIFTLSAGFLLTFVSVAFYLGSHDLIRLSVYHMLSKSLEITKLHSLPFPSLTQLIPTSFTPSGILSSFTAFFGYLILTSYLVTAILLIKKARNFKFSEKYALTLLIAGLFAIPYIFGRSDMGHMVKGGMPAILLLAWTGYNTYQHQKYISAIIIFCFFGVFSVQVLQSVWWLRFNNTKTIIGNYSLILNQDYIPGSTLVSAETLSKAVSFLQNNSSEGEQVLILPYMAGLYFLSDRPSATQFNNVLDGFLSTPEEEKKFIEKIITSNVGIVIYDPQNGPKMKRSSLMQYNPLVHQFIIDTYNIVDRTPEGWLFMKHK